LWVVLKLTLILAALWILEAGWCWIEKGCEDHFN